MRKTILEASTVKYDSSVVEVYGDEISGVDIHGHFDGDSASVDVSELWEKWIYVFCEKMKISSCFFWNLWEVSILKILSIYLNVRTSVYFLYL